MAYISKNIVFEDDPDQARMLRERGFGEERDGKLLVSPTEALYLLENKRIRITKGKKELKFKDLLSALGKEDDGLGLKYLVYKDLRSKGYVVRTGFKFGTCFRVYEKGIRVGEGHSHMLVYPVPEGKKTSMTEIGGMIQLSHSVKKAVLFAVVDGEGDVTYIKMGSVVL